MDVYDAIKKRRSIRKYKDLPIEWEKVVRILEAGQYSPSSGNLQDWKFIVVVKEETKKAIAKACLNQTWIQSAPTMIVICSIPERTLQYYGDRGKKYTIENCACVGMSMMLEATEQGLGSCWVGAFDEAMMCDVLNIPDRARPMSVIVFGYADEEPPTPPRIVLESIVFLHAYACRVRDISYVIWDWSVMMENYAKRGKKAIQKQVTNIKEILKNKLEKKKQEEEKKEVNKQHNIQYKH